MVALLRDPHQVQVHVLLNFLLLLIVIAPTMGGHHRHHHHKFRIKEATISEIQNAFQHEKLTSRQLVKFYLREISKLNPLLRGVIEVNPDAIHLAEKADKERKSMRGRGCSSRLHHLHGIPILLKDNIATKDRMNTTAGSLALLGSIVPRDAGVVKKLRKAGAIILGKASLSEWAYFRSDTAPSGWNARAGQGKNPYVLSASPCGSSSGSAISVAANLATVTLGTETDGSILCPSSSNSVVGIKPTVGLTSRSGVIPISPRQDTVGPMCRTVADAVYVLDTIVGFDKRDADATTVASKFIPKGGYLQFLKPDGLKGKRLGILRNPSFSPPKDSIVTLRQQGVVLVENLNISHLDIILDGSSELILLAVEFKVALNAYLKELVVSPVRSLADVIAFNKKFSDLEMIDEYGQDLFLKSEATNGVRDKEKQLGSKLEKLSRDGLEKLMREHKLDALVTSGPYTIAPLLAIGGLPGISVPAGYDPKGLPFGICFGGRKGSEPKLIEIAYAFEQATRVRQPPSFKP